VGLDRLEVKRVKSLWKRAPSITPSSTYEPFSGLDEDPLSLLKCRLPRSNDFYASLIYLVAILHGQFEKSLKSNPTKSINKLCIGRREIRKKGLDGDIQRAGDALVGVIKGNSSGPRNEVVKISQPASIEKKSSGPPRTRKYRD